MSDPSSTWLKFEPHGAHCSGCDEQAIDALPWAVFTLLALYVARWIRGGRRPRAAFVRPP